MRLYEGAILLIVAICSFVSQPAGSVESIVYRFPGFDTYGSRVDGADCWLLVDGLGLSNFQKDTSTPLYGCVWTEETNRRSRESVECYPSDWLVKHQTFIDGDGKIREYGAHGLFIPTSGCDSMTVPRGWAYETRVAYYSGGVFIRLDFYRVDQDDSHFNLPTIWPPPPLFWDGGDKGTKR